MHLLIFIVSRTTNYTDVYKTVLFENTHVSLHFRSPLGNSSRKPTGTDLDQNSKSPHHVILCVQFFQSTKFQPISLKHRFYFFKLFNRLIQLKIGIGIVAQNTSTACSLNITIFTRNKR